MENGKWGSTAAFVLKVIRTSLFSIFYFLLIDGYFCFLADNTNGVRLTPLDAQ